MPKRIMRFMRLVRDLIGVKNSLNVLISSLNLSWVLNIAKRNLKSIVGCSVRSEKVARLNPNGSQYAN